MSWTTSTFLLLFSLACVVAGRNTAKAGPKSQVQSAETFADAARAEFAKSNFDKAIELYKKYLRSVPTDYAAWSQMGAAYYYTGLPRTALRTLQKVERLTPDQSYNYYYQGLCLSVLGMEANAVRYWEYAAYFGDEPAGKAMLELGYSAYNRKDDARARYWLQTYIARFPQSPQAAKATELLKSMEPNGTRIEDAKASDRPDPEASVFRYHRWSLYNYPHFWQVQVGTLYEDIEGYQPKPHYQIEKRAVENDALLANASIGIGPVRQKNTSAFAGYSYRQRWDTNQQILQTWMNDPFNYQLFPFRGEYLERTHQLFGDVRHQFGESFLAGTYARMEFSREGSSFFPSPDDSDLLVVVSLKDSQLFIPWMGYIWNENMRTMMYLYLRKEINRDNQPHSNQTYDFTGTTGDKAMSLGISHAMEFPAIGLDVNAEVFQYEFIFNDYWLDYTRTGAIVGADYNVWSKLNLAVLAGMYNDDYKLPRIKIQDCNTQAVQENSASSDIQQCKRADSGTMLQAGVYWNYSSTTRFSLSYQMVDNSSVMKEYSETKQTAKLDVTWAFPSIRRVQRFTERFADAAFTKNNDD